MPGFAKNGENSMIGNAKLLYVDLSKKLYVPKNFLRDYQNIPGLSQECTVVP